MASPAITVTTIERRSLVAKLAEVMAAVKRIAKRGRNDHFKYDFATEADIAEAIRQELADRSVMLVPAIVNETRTEIGKTSSGAVKVLTILDLSMTFFDGDSEATIVRPWKGWGIDSEDKGGYKAITGGEKYFLLKTFLIPTGDDPERHEKDQRSQDRATVKPDKEVQRARKAQTAKAALPPGVVYIEKVIPKSNGDREWAEIVTSDGESLIARDPGCIALAYELAQAAAPVEIITSRNSKGNLQIDEITRWKIGAGTPAQPAEPPAEREPGSDDVGF